MLTAAAARYGIPTEAEDVVHEAFLRARGYAGLDIARLRPFLLTVVKRLCIDERRRRAAAQRVAKHPGQLLPPALDPAEAVADRHEARWLLAQCGRLSDREHFVLQRLASGIDHAQIAAELGTTRRATECLASRARCRARAALADRRRGRW